MSNANEFGEPLLEFLDVWSVIAQPTTIKKSVDACHQTFAVANVGATHVQLLAKGRSAAKDG
jgi:hypothetical protein